MIDYDSQLKIQAYLDGELPEAEAQQVAKRLAQDQDAVLLLSELRNTRQAMVNAQAPMALPETREFFWSKIEREIGRQESPQPAPRRNSMLAAWRRMLVPAGAVAAVGLVCMLSLVSSPGPRMETALADSGAFTYRDYNSGATLVWLSYPAENEFADSEPAGTVQ
jgi:anti-sigma factor RsiW